MLTPFNEIPREELVEMRAKFRTLAKSALENANSRQYRLKGRIDRQVKDAKALETLEASLAKVTANYDEMVAANLSANAIADQAFLVQEAQTRLNDFLSGSGGISNENAYVEQAQIDDLLASHQSLLVQLAAIEAALSP